MGSNAAVIGSSYDLVDRQVAADGEGPASSMVYNSLGWVLRTVDADGISTNRTYDVTGKVVAEGVVPTSGSTRTTTTTYDPAGRIVSSTDPEGRVSAYSYDVFGRISHERQTTGAGLVKDVSTAYDSLGRVLQTTDAKTGVSTSVAYPTGSPGDILIAKTYAGVTTTQTIGADGLETSIASNLSGTSLTRSTTTRDAAGRETAWSVGGKSYSRAFSDSGLLTGYGAPSTVATLTYDAAARKATDKASLGLGSTIDLAYTYTDGGRLATLKPSGAATTTYTFDLAGNLVTQSDGTTQVDMSYDTSTTQRLINRKVGGSVVATYTFDAFGQRIAQGPVSSPATETFGYTGTGRLASYATSSGASATYSYDASGQRTRSVVRQGSLTTTTTYTYEGLSLLSLAAERSDGATWSVSYLTDAEGRPYAGVYASGAATPTVFQMVTTDRGDVVSLLDTTGAAFAAYRYDVWGLPTETTSTATAGVTSAVASAIASRQPLRYAGYAFDEHSGLYYLSARSYDPVTRQFLSKDPAKDDGEESAYQYCGGDPVGKVDPSGEARTYVNAMPPRYFRYNARPVSAWFSIHLGHSSDFEDSKGFTDAKGRPLGKSAFRGGAAVALWDSMYCYAIWRYDPASRWHQLDVSIVSKKTAPQVDVKYSPGGRWHTVYTSYRYGLAPVGKRVVGAKVSTRQPAYAVSFRRPWGAAFGRTRTFYNPFN